MAIYQLAIGIGTIIFIAFMWSILSYETESLADTFKASTQSFNTSFLNDTTVKQQYTLSTDTVYIFMFFAVIIVLVWVVKESAQEQSSKFGGY